jgi:hypothetical protein
MRKTIPFRPGVSGQAQRTLFGDAAPAESSLSQAVLAIPIPASAQNKAQRDFNRLISQIGQQRELLAQWQGVELRHRQRLVAEMQPLQRQLREARLALLRLLDALLGDIHASPKLTKPQRRKLAAWIPQLAGMLLEEGDDAEVEAVFDRYSDVTHAELRQADLAGAAAMFGHVLGEDALKGHQAESIDDLMQHAAEHMAARAEAEQQTREQAREQARDGRAQQSARGRKAEAARQRQTEASQQAGQSVREVFRKLASALHPDRETDAGERERKTALMQQANDAYGRNDLLTLLTMQLALEQIDDQHLANLPDARLAHYNQVLREQLQVLQQEVQACVQPFRVTLGSIGRALTPAAVDSALTADLADMRQGLRAMAHDIALLRDPATRRGVINGLEMPDDGDGPDAFEMMLMMEALAGTPAAAGRRKKRR